ncbi:MAG: hypothetical protein ABJE66_32920 [Deltaproteobacteria bacterium]
MGESDEHPLFEQTRRALDGLRDIASIPDLAIRSESVWARQPREVGLDGDDLAARTALIDALHGTPVLVKRAPGGPPIRIRRGSAVRVRGRRDDGSVVEHALVVHRDEDAAAERDALHRSDHARAELATREVALERAAAAVPGFVRTRPTGWRVSLWPIWWLLTWLRRRELAQRAGAAEAVELARDAARVVDGELADLSQHTERDAAAYAGAVRALAAAGDVVELELEVTSDRLDAGVDLCELGATGASFDAVVIVAGGSIRAPGGEPIGGYDALVGLGAFASAARAMKLARRACKTIALAVATLDKELAHAESSFDARIRAIEAHRIADASAFIAERLALVRPQIVTSVNAVIEHASVHLGAELAALGEDWISGIVGCTTNDALKETIARIETTAAATLQRIADETRTLVVGGGGGSAHDLYPMLIAPLVERGLPDAGSARRQAPVLPALEVLPRLSSTPIAKLSGQWLGGLFRSFDTRRTEVREKAHVQIEQLRELATAELLDVEPRLHAAIEQALAPQLVAACDRQAAAVGAALDAEYAAIARERLQLAAVIEQRARAHAILVDLRGELAALEARQPTCAAASAAVPDLV